VKLLLDTHALIWALSSPGRLPARVRSAVEDPENLIFASAASVWEMAIKQALGRLSFPLDRFAGALAKASIAELAIAVAQAAIEGLSLVSNDRLVRRYQVTVFWR